MNCLTPQVKTKSISDQGQRTTLSLIPTAGPNDSSRHPLTYCTTVKHYSLFSLQHISHHCVLITDANNNCLILASDINFRTHPAHRPTSVLSLIIYQIQDARNHVTQALQLLSSHDDSYHFKTGAEVNKVCPLSARDSHTLLQPAHS